MCSLVSRSTPNSRRHARLCMTRRSASASSSRVARRYRTRHSRVSHMRSSSVMGPEPTFAVADVTFTSVKARARSVSHASFGASSAVTATRVAALAMEGGARNGVLTGSEAFSGGVGTPVEVPAVSAAAMAGGGFGEGETVGTGGSDCSGSSEWPLQMVLEECPVLPTEVDNRKRKKGKKTPPGPELAESTSRTIRGALSLPVLGIRGFPRPADRPVRLTAFRFQIPGNPGPDPCQSIILHNFEWGNFRDRLARLPQSSVCNHVRLGEAHQPRSSPSGRFFFSFPPAKAQPQINTHRKHRLPRLSAHHPRPSNQLARDRPLKTHRITKS